MLRICRWSIKKNVQKQQMCSVEFKRLLWFQFHCCFCVQREPLILSHNSHPLELLPQFRKKICRKFFGHKKNTVNSTHYHHLSQLPFNPCSTSIPQSLVAWWKGVELLPDHYRTLSWNNIDILVEVVVMITELMAANIDWQFTIWCKVKTNAFNINRISYYKQNN